MEMNIRLVYYLCEECQVLTLARSSVLSIGDFICAECDNFRSYNYDTSFTFIVPYARNLLIICDKERGGLKAKDFVDLKRCTPEELLFLHNRKLIGR